MGNIPRSKEDRSNKYTSDQIRSIEEESLKRDKEPMDILIDEWGTSGRSRPTILDLWQLCADLNMMRACDYIAGPILGRREEEILSQSECWVGREDVQEGGDLKDANSGRKMDFHTATDSELNKALDPLLDSAESRVSQEIPAENGHFLPQFTYSFLESITNSFSNVPYTDGGNKIGAGAFSGVYYGRLSGQLGGIELVVVKKLNRNAPKIKQQFNNEVEMMSLVDHPNILKLLAFSNDGEELCLLYPMMENGNLAERLALKSSPSPLTPMQRLKIIFGMAKGIAYLHDGPHCKPIVHRDIKPDNVLLDGQLDPKIADFGLVRLAKCEDFLPDITTTVMGTDVYMAPEAFRGEISVKLDVFSFGVVLIELLTSLPAYDEEREERSLISHLEETCDDDITPLLDSNFSLAEWRQISYTTLFGLATSCLSSSESERPRMADICDDVAALF